MPIVNMDGLTVDLEEQRGPVEPRDNDLMRRQRREPLSYAGDSLAAGANSFVRKPIARSDWGRTMGAVVDYWLLHDESIRALADAR